MAINPNSRVYCIIVDDEPKAASLLKSNLETLFDELDIIEMIHHWSDALRVLRKTDIDILFLDISMPGKSGLDLLDLIPELSCEIIFTTAYSEHAIKAFKYSTSGYLVKPIDEIELSNTVNKTLKRVTQKKQIQSLNKRSKQEQLAIAHQQGTDIVDLEDVVFLEAINNCTKIYTTTGEYTSSYPIGKYKQVFENSHFYQVHRSFIVNLKQIKSYSREGILTLRNGREIPLARNQKDAFLDNFLKVGRTEG